jgi:hypothetical protein
MLRDFAIPVGFDPTDLSALALFSASLLVFAAIGLVALYRERDLRPTEQRTTLACWYDDTKLKDVAAQNGVDRKPVEVETTSGHGVGIRLPSVLGKAEGGTRTVHKPYDDRGELISRLLERLDEVDRLNRDADQLHLAGRLAAIDDEVPEWELRARLEATHRALAESESSIQLLEGEWEVEGEEGDLLLMRTDVRIADSGGREPRSLPLPDGIAIHVRLDGELTHHGRAAMLGVTQPIHAGVLGTVRQREPATGCLQIVPIAVFQRG